MNGKRLPVPDFAGDEGAADPHLAAAQRAHADDPARLPEVLAALHRGRVLAPVVAVLEAATSAARDERRRSATGDAEAATPATPAPPGARDEAPLRAGKSSDIALPLLLDGEGHKAVPVFSSLATLARWDSAARPVPVAGPRAAAVAIAEQAEALVLDVAGPWPVTLGLPEVHALAEGRAPVPAYDDEALARAVSDLLGADPGVTRGWIGAGVGVDAVVTVAVDPAASSDQVGARLAAQLQGLARAGVRGLDLALQPRTAPEPDGRLVYSARRPS